MALYLILERKSHEMSRIAMDFFLFVQVRIPDRPEMTPAVKLGCKTTN